MSDVVVTPPAGPVTLVLPGVSQPAVSYETAAGRIVVPGQDIPEKRIVVDPVLVRALVQAARAAARDAYVRYSGFHVGAALIMDDDPNGTVFSGANVENSSYGVTCCGERTALYQAAAKGFRTLRYLAVSTADALDRPLRSRTPCGVCRQAIREFTALDVACDEALVLIDNGTDNVLCEAFDIERLLPYGFRLED